MLGHQKATQNIVPLVDLLLIRMTLSGSCKNSFLKHFKGASNALVTQTPGLAHRKVDIEPDKLPVELDFSPIF
jgi:hypothetical protein